MANQWFRLYHEFASDPKIQSMPEHMQRRLVIIFCLRCSNVLETLQENEIIFALGISEKEWEETKQLFVSKCFIRFISGKCNVINWNKRQFISDSSTERVKKYREKNATLQKRYKGVTVTPSDTDTDTDTDTDIKRIQDTKKQATKHFSKPSLEEVQAYCQERKNLVGPRRFLDYYESNGWKVGKNPMKDWKAAIRTWERTEGEKQNGRTGTIPTPERIIIPDFSSPGSDRASKKS
jgi:hypothetical protein